MKELELEPMKAAETSTELIFDNVSFVITGSLEHYKNRDDLIKSNRSKRGQSRQQSQFKDKLSDK
jgi:DNA ligase (NAD+)